MARFDLTDFEWSVIEPVLPNKPRGVPRVDDRRVLNGIFWRLRTGAPWADIPERYGPHTTCVNRFNRWRRAGVWDRLLDVVSKAYDGGIQMIDSSSIRVHQHAANAQKKTATGGTVSAVDTARALGDCFPASAAVPPGSAFDYSNTNTALLGLVVE